MYLQTLRDRRRKTFVLTASGVSSYVLAALFLQRELALRPQTRALLFCEGDRRDEIWKQLAVQAIYAPLPRGVFGRAVDFHTKLEIVDIADLPAKEQWCPESPDLLIVDLEESVFMEYSEMLEACAPQLFLLLFPNHKGDGKDIVTSAFSARNLRLLDLPRFLKTRRSRSQGSIYEYCDAASFSAQRRRFRNAQDYEDNAHAWDPLLTTTPYNHYPDSFPGWDYYLGIGFAKRIIYTFEQALEVMAREGVTTGKQYQELRKREERLPFSPREHYQKEYREGRRLFTPPRGKPRKIPPPET